jgi:hypothetical protein
MAGVSGQEAVKTYNGGRLMGHPRGGVRDGAGGEAWCVGERRGLRGTVHVLSLPASPWPDDLMHRPGGCQRQRCTIPSTIACRGSSNHDCPCSLLPSASLRLALSALHTPPTHTPMFFSTLRPRQEYICSLAASGISCAIVYLLQPHWHRSRGHRTSHVQCRAIIS